MLVIHPAYNLISNILPRNPQGRLRSYKLLNRIASCELVSDFVCSYPSMSVDPITAPQYAGEELGTDDRDIKAAGHFDPGKKCLRCTYLRTMGWPGTRSWRFEGQKNLLFCQQSNHDSTVVEPVTQSTYRMSYPASTRSCHVKYYENKTGS
jgi:hypothetical protein